MLGNSGDNKRIAKNTLLLYIRMLFLMIVSLYTSRVILNALGVQDYGIYTIVGGVVMMFSMLSGSLSAAISRFITFELGTGDYEKLKKVFSSSVTIQSGIALIVIIIAETIGLWFLNEKMVIPGNRLIAANWVFQFSIITFTINLISVPYNAAIIANEKMSTFAYISILEAVGKLLIAWCITISPIDRLVFYAFMVSVLSWIICMIYYYYCKRHFEECSYHFIYDHDLLKRMFRFAGWNFIGASAAILRDQGGSIFLNIFYGPIVNAAQAISLKVNAAITGFVQSFMTALNPQITKSFAINNRTYMFELVFRGARFSYYILLVLSLPVLMNTHFLLVVWLKLVPEYTVVFVQLILVLAMSECISYPLITAMLATGNIRNYQIIVGGLQLLNLPISYFCLKMGGSPESILIVAIVISQCCLIARLCMLHNMIGLDVRSFFYNVYINIIIVTIFASIISFVIVSLLDDSLLHFILKVFLCIGFTFFSEYYIGCNKNERTFLKTKSQQIVRRLIGYYTLK